MKNKRLNFILKLNFYIFLFFLPFNGLPYFKEIFKELSAEASYYPLYIFVLLSFIYYLFKRKEFKFTKNYSFYLFVAFIVWVLVSGVVNYNRISLNYFKYRTGTEKFMLQFLVLNFVFTVSLFLYNFFRKYDLDDLFRRIRNIVVLSFIVILFFGFFEFLKKFLGIDNIIENFRGFITIGYKGYGDRLHSICGEPSWFGVYLTFGLPWILSCFIERIRLKYFVLYFFIFLFSYFTFSRTVYIIFVIQTFVFSLIIGFYDKNYKKMLKYFIVFCIPSILLFLNTAITSIINTQNKTANIINTQNKTANIINTQNKTANIINTQNKSSASNITRIGMQTAAVKIGLDNPVFGVGLGQFGFNFPKYLPEWALDSYEIKSYLDPNDKFFPPSHGLFPRLIAETGFVGFLIYIFMCFLFLIEILKNYKNNFKPFNFVILLSILSFFLLGFSYDSFRFLGYWFILSLGWYIFDYNEEKLIKL
jgi:O-antigen ligase